MNYLDIIIGILLFLAAIRGFRKGFIVELASLAAFILGVWGAIEFSYITENFIIKNFNFETDHLYLISFVITFIIIVILVHFAGSAINKFIEAVMLGFLNRIAGLAFAVIRSALIISIILIVFEVIDEDMKIISRQTRTESRLYGPVRNFAPSLLPFLDITDDKENSPDDKVDDILTKIKKTINL
ncbi:MAG: CvpA family protein [Prolixibacteraceae bacterium]|nr:CvpA family protein [Prolixibacteraceae bacterium]